MYSKGTHTHTHTHTQDELLAELEELEQEELEEGLLDVETPSAPLEDPSEQLPDVREYQNNTNTLQIKRLNIHHKRTL